MEGYVTEYAMYWRRLRHDSPEDYRGLPLRTEMVFRKGIHFLLGQIVRIDNFAGDPGQLVISGPEGYHSLDEFTHCLVFKDPDE